MVERLAIVMYLQFQTPARLWHKGVSPLASPITFGSRPGDKVQTFTFIEQHLQLL